MKTMSAKVICVLLGLGMMVFAGAGHAAEPLGKERNRSHMELDPGNTGTYTGEAGQDNYVANCSPCHGMTGNNDGPLSENLGEGVVPRKLNDAALMSSRSDDFLFKVVKFGGPSAGFTDAMPGWKETFNDNEIRQIIRHIRNGICKCKYEGK